MYRVVHVYPNFTKTGGIERYLVELCSALSRSRKCRSQICVYEKAEVPFPGGVLPIRLPAIRSPLFLRVLMFAAFATCWILFRRRDKETIVHLQGASAFCGDVITAQSVHRAWFFASLRKLRPLSWPWLRKIFNPIHYAAMLIERIQYFPWSYGRVVAISQSVARDLTRCYGVPPSRIDVIYSAVNLIDFHPSRATERPDFPGSDRIEKARAAGHLIMIFVGNEFRRKGLSVVLHAMADRRLHKTTLLVLGRDDRQPFLEDSRFQSVLDRVVWLDATADVGSRMAASDVFVFPTQYEPFGLVITEAMACGLPVITSQLAGAAELISDSLDGFLLKDPESVSELTEKISVLLSPDVRRGVGVAARKCVEALTWDSLVEKQEAVYRLVAKT